MSLRDSGMIWLDMETTGLTPLDNDMLEIGLMLTDEELNPIETYETLMMPNRYTPWTWRDRCEPIVRDMHDRSGLWDALTMALDERADGLASLPLAEQNVLDWLGHVEETYGIDVSKQPLCGSSIHFDRTWLNIRMPRVNNAFHYRIIDTSTIKELVRRRHPLIYSTLPEKKERHRVVPDLFDTLEEARHYFNNLHI